MQITYRQNVAIVNSGDPRHDLPFWTRLLRAVDELDCAAVIDVRQSECGLSEIDAYLLALNTDDLTRLRSHRLALVMSGAQAGAFFATCARGRGLDVAVFDELQPACEWIATPESAEKPDAPQLVVVAPPKS